MQKMFTQTQMRLKDKHTQVWLHSSFYTSLVLIKAFQNGFMARLFQEVHQIFWAEPHSGSVGHGVEINMTVPSLHQVLVQD